MQEKLPAASTPFSAGHAERTEHREWIGGAISTLLGFYFVPTDTDDRLDAEMGRMWMDDLERFERGVIQRAITDWRRNQNRRPTPADIRRLCIAYTPKPVALPPPEHRYVEPDSEARERIRALVEKHWPELRRVQRSGDE